MDFKDKQVVITGGSIGIGLELAHQLLSEGANVLVCARNSASLEAAKAAHPNLEIFQCDVTKPEQVKQLYQASLNLLGSVDVLINNAAVFRRFNVLEGYPIEKQIEEVSINFNGILHVTNRFLPLLHTRQEGLIVNLTSPAAMVPLSGAPVYSAVKAAVSSYTTSLRFQLRKTNVKVILLCPPAVDTRMNENNPGVEAQKLMSKEKFVTQAIKGLKRGKKEILVSPINFFKQINRIAPNVAYNMINK
jgi:uncharacterized oxidoreductase